MVNGSSTSSGEEEAENKELRAELERYEKQGAQEVEAKEEQRRWRWSNGGMTSCQSTRKCRKYHKR